MPDVYNFSCWTLLLTELSPFGKLVSLFSVLSVEIDTAFVEYGFSAFCKSLASLLLIRRSLASPELDKCCNK